MEKLASLINFRGGLSGPDCEVFRASPEERKFELNKGEDLG